MVSSSSSSTEASAAASSASGFISCCVGSTESSSGCTGLAGLSPQAANNSRRLATHKIKTDMWKFFAEHVRYNNFITIPLWRTRSCFCQYSLMIVQDPRYYKQKKGELRLLSFFCFVIPLGLSLPDRGDASKYCANSSFVYI